MTAIETKELAHDIYSNGKIKPMSTPVADLYHKLIYPFVENSGQVDLARIVTETAVLGTIERQQAEDIVNYAYNADYLVDGGRVINVAADFFDSLPTSRTIVAVSASSEPQQVLATMRIITGDDLELFKLFEMSEERPFWPHQCADGSSRTPGEIGRFSIHPVFDLFRKAASCELRALGDYNKRMLLRKLYAHAIDLFKEEGIEDIYYIAGLHVRRFLNGAGVEGIRLVGARPSSAPEVVGLREKFSEYWRPHQPPRYQPSVYIAPHELKPLGEAQK